MSRASARTFILTLDSVQHLPTFDQGTKRNVFQFSFVPYLEWESSHGHDRFVPEPLFPRMYGRHPRCLPSIRTLMGHCGPGAYWGPI